MLLALLSAAGCERGFEELNKNPNIDTTVDPDALFAQSVLKYHTDYFHGVLTEVWAVSTWTQMQASLNGIASADGAYFIGGDALDNTWRVFYSDVLGNASEAMRLTETDDALSNHYHIYRIWRAFVMHRVTDMWGDVPFSEAFNAVNANGDPIFTPAYDSQQSIYHTLLDELAASSAALDENKSAPELHDWLYGGNIDTWRRFANTLRLRMALRMLQADPGRAEQELASLNQEFNFISLNQESARFPHSNSARSPFYELDATGQGMYSPSHFMVELFKAHNDPRLEQLATLAPQTIIFGAPDYVGVPNFMLASEIDPNQWNDFTTSYIAPQFLDVLRPGVTLSVAESRLLEAEAVLRGYLPNHGLSAQQLYEFAVQAHFERLGLTVSQANDYLANAGAFQGTIEQLITEKWKTFVYTDPLEAWAEYRRTGFPILPDENGTPVAADNVPKRFAYPQTELSLNAAAVQAVGEGINDFETPLWWDVD